MNFLLLVALAVFQVVSCATSYTSAWIAADGKVVSSSSFTNVTKVGTGHYCIDVGPVGTYQPIQATIQSGDGKPGLIIANSGWYEFF